MCFPPTPGPSDCLSVLLKGLEKRKERSWKGKRSWNERKEAEEWDWTLSLNKVAGYWWYATWAVNSFSSQAFAHVSLPSTLAVSLVLWRCTRVLCNMHSEHSYSSFSTSGRDGQDLISDPKNQWTIIRTHPTVHTLLICNWTPKFDNTPTLAYPLIWFITLQSIFHQSIAKTKKPNSKQQCATKLVKSRGPNVIQCMVAKKNNLWTHWLLDWKPHAFRGRGLYIWGSGVRSLDTKRIFYRTLWANLQLIQITFL